MKIAEGYEIAFTSTVSGHASDDALLWKISKALEAYGFRGKRRGLGSSGMETCFSILRGRLEIAMNCCTHPEASDLSFWYLPTWFWRRWLQGTPAPAEVEEALEIIREVCERVLRDEPQVSNVLTMSIKQRRAQILASTQGARH